MSSRLFPLLLLAALPAVGQSLSTTNVQLAHAARLHDPWFGYDATGTLQTVTLEHYRASESGDVYAFVDVLHGQHATSEGVASGDVLRAYGELCARLNAATLAGRKVTVGPVRDVYLAAEIDRGRGYTAWLTGVGIDLAVPGLDTATVNVFHKDDNFNGPAAQVTVLWSRRVPAFGGGLTFAGYVDASTTDRDGIDVSAQPQLLVDAPFLQTAAGSLAVGVELYVHRNAEFRTAVPQLLLKWTF